MKKFYRVLATVFSCLFLLPLYSCNKKDFSYYGFCFNTDISVITYEKEILEQEQAEINQILKELDDEFSLEKDSFLTRFNNLPANETMQISKLGVELFSYIKKYCSYTEFFNPAVYPLLKLWHFTPDSTVNDAEFIPPTDDEISSVIKNNSFNPVAFTIDEEKNTILKTEKISFDVGGIVKGFAVDKLRDILIKNGHKEGYISFGGSSIYVLKVNSLSIAHPERPNENIIKIGLNENFSVSTSGTYRTYYSYNGKNYSHIIDAKTGKPSTTTATSAIVICRDGAFADAMSTALLLCPKSEVIDFIKELSGNKSNYVYEVFVVFDDGEKKEIVTSEKQGDFTLLDENYSIISVT